MSPQHDDRGLETTCPLRPLQFGFDLDRLYLRFDLGESAAQKLGDGIRCSVNFTTPADRRLVLSASDGTGVASLFQRGKGGWEPVAEATLQIAVGEILEAAVAFGDLGLVRQRVRILRVNPNDSVEWNAIRPIGPSKASSLSPRSRN